MSILLPKYVALDSSTLGNISRDHWSGDTAKHARAKALMEQMRDAGIYVVISYTHLCELLRHDDIGVAKERVAWLGTLPMVAWIRPYDGHWWVGGMVDIALRELSAILHHAAKDWSAILTRVRPSLLETGVGNDMFVDRPELWALVRSRARQNLENQIYVASLARADWADAYSRKFKEFETLAEMPQANDEANIRQAVRVAKAIEDMVTKHGDTRISASDAAKDFVVDLMKDLGKVEAIGGNPYHAIMQHFGVPKEMVGPETTIGEIGELGVHSAHLKLLQSALQPPVAASVVDAPPNSMPSFTVERELLREQHGASRVGGSDLGDCHLVPLAMYLDAVEVDKRAHDHVRKIRQRHGNIATHLGQVFPSPDYTSIPSQLAAIGVL